MGGEDWLELSLYLQHRNFPQLKRRLDAAREAAESNERGPDELEIAGRKFLMLPSAALAGTKQKQVVYRWRLQSEDGWWLTHEWLRITASAVDPQHPDRAPVHPDWIAIQDAMADWSGAPVGELSPLPRLPIRAEHLLQQIVGALVSYHARVGTVVDSDDAFIHESLAAILDTIEDRNMAEEVRRRALEIGAGLR